jgi:DNA adenine methylase
MSNDGHTDTPENIQPLFCRQGNKYNLRNEIVPIIPPHKTYVELFAGSGAIFYNKEKAVKNVLNDLDKDTLDRFKLLKKAPLDVEKYPDFKGSLKVARHFFDHHGDAIADRVMLEKLKTCTGFQNNPVKKSTGIYKAPMAKNVVRLMSEYQEKLDGTILENKDYEAVVKKYDGPDTFFFVDPPYENTNKSFGYAEDKGFDFERLERVLKSIKGKFLMTINDSKRIRQLFKDFRIKAVDVPDNWTTAGKKGSKRGVRKELFITNYNI